MPTLGMLIVSEHAPLLQSAIEWGRKIGVFDQIVAVADADAEEAVADVAFRHADKHAVMSVKHQERVMNPTIALVDTDWIFRLDDDERMGEWFVNDVRGLIERDEADVYESTRCWLWPDSRHFISNQHWYPDLQMRLWKKGHVYHSNPEGVHVALTATGRVATAAWDSFHYVLLWYSYQARIAKCQKYSDLSGIPLGDFTQGLSLFYLPEEYRASYTISPCKEAIVL